MLSFKPAGKKRKERENSEGREKHFWDVNSDGDLAVDPKRINHFEVHFDVRFEQVSELPSSCASGAFGLRKPYRDE